MKDNKGRALADAIGEVLEIEVDNFVISLDTATATGVMFYCNKQTAAALIMEAQEKFFNAWGRGHVEHVEVEAEK